MEEETGAEVALTVKQMVFEMRSDLKTLAHKVDTLENTVHTKMDRIDREGTHALKDVEALIKDQEERIRVLEQWRYGIPVGVILASLAAAFTLLQALNQ